MLGTPHACTHCAHCSSRNGTPSILASLTCRKIHSQPLSWKGTSCSWSARHTSPTPEKCLVPLTPPVLSIQRCFSSHSQTPTLQRKEIKTCPPLSAITPHKYFQHPHHSSKIPSTHHFTSYRQQLLSIPSNPKLQWFRMEMPLASPLPRTPPSSFMSRYDGAGCGACTADDGYVGSRDQLPVLGWVFFNTLDKRGTTFPFGCTSLVLPWSHGDWAAVLHSAGAGKHKLLQKTPPSSISHQEPVAPPLTHRLQGLGLTCKGPDG